MLNFRTLAIIKRELREKLLSKAFIIMTVMLPVLMFVFIGFQAWIMDYAGDSNTKIEIITETIDLSAQVNSFCNNFNFSVAVSSVIHYPRLKADEHKHQNRKHYGHNNKRF